MDRGIEKPPPIAPETHIDSVHYTVADLDRQIAFYTEILGFHLRSRTEEFASLGTDQRELLRLTVVPGARRVHGTTGLYHTAFLVPTRWDLAHLLYRIAESRTPIQGTSNHGTHLALYLPDAEGNGVELAWDFPKEEWPMRDGDIDFLRMPRTGVDVNELMEELKRNPAPWPGLPPSTIVGHVHLHSSDIASAREFYHGLLGFDITMDHDEFGALFVSAGGYHHHIGLNIWRGHGAPPPPPDALGLRYYTIAVPTEEELERLVGRLQDAGVEVGRDAAGVSVRDPASIGIRFVVQGE